MQQLKLLLENKLLIVSISAWATAQVMKFLLGLILNRKLSFERLYGAGGMPSAHSAMVCALAIISARVEGAQSSIFAITVILAAIVMYDAMGVRYAAGEHAKMINRIVESIEDSEQQNNSNLKEALGHTPLEVLAGALCGILVAMILG